MSAHPENIMSSSPLFQRVCDLENPLSVALDLARAIAMIAPSIEENGGDPQDIAVLCRLAWLAADQIKAAEAIYGDLFRATHPKRAKFEATGWPGKAVAS
jgi:hypothetical protein